MHTPRVDRRFFASSRGQIVTLLRRAQSTVDDLARNDDDRGIMNFLLSGNKLGRPLAAPPGTPEARVETLRAAFEATMKDPRFRKDVETAKAEFGPIPGDVLQASTAQILKTPARLVERARKILE